MLSPLKLLPCRCLEPEARLLRLSRGREASAGPAQGHLLRRATAAEAGHAHAGEDASLAPIFRPFLFSQSGPTFIKECWWKTWGSILNSILEKMLLLLDHLGRTFIQECWSLRGSCLIGVQETAWRLRVSNRLKNSKTRLSNILQAF